MTSRYYVLEALKNFINLPKGLILTSDLTKAQRNNINIIKDKVNKHNSVTNNKKNLQQ